MAAGVKQGRWLWVAPLGYLNDTHTKQTIPDPKRAGLVRKAFELIAQGLLVCVPSCDFHGTHNTYRKTNT